MQLPQPLTWGALFLVPHKCLCLCLSPTGSSLGKKGASVLTALGHPAGQRTNQDDEPWAGTQAPGQPATQTVICCPLVGMGRTVAAQLPRVGPHNCPAVWGRAESADAGLPTVPS